MLPAAGPGGPEIQGFADNRLPAAGLTRYPLCDWRMVATLNNARAGNLSLDVPQGRCELGRHSYMDSAPAASRSEHMRVRVAYSMCRVGIGRM